MNRNWWGRILALGAGVALLATTAVAEPLKVGFVYVGPIGDHGWSYQHDQGRLALEAALGDQVETTYVESVPEGADAERVIRQLASTGHKLIFTTSFGYMNPTNRVARAFPDVAFEHATGYQRGPNVSTYAARFYEGRYIAGLIAGHMTESGVIGYIGSHPIPEVIRGINSFTLALRSVRPDAEVKVVWVNSWYDPGREADAAKALIDQGADIILQHTDSPAPVQAAQERGVLAVGQASDMARFGPNSHLTAIVDVWDDYYIDRAKAVIAGTWSSQDTWGGLSAGMLEMSSYNAAIPSNVVAIAKAAEAGIMDGSLKPFAGPIRNQAGELVVPAGQAIPDGDLLSMDWYVEGVQGSIPQ